MDNYKIRLYSKLYYAVDVALHIKNSEEILADYYAIIDDKCVFNDQLYSIRLFENDNEKIIEYAYINNERVDITKAFSAFFLECFGIVKIEIIIDGTSYVTDNIKVMINKSNVNKSLINMIDYIYNNCDDYLYEEHKHSKISSGIIQNSHVSIDSKLSLLEKIYNSYIECYRILRYSAHSKLENVDKVGNFSELHNVRQNTIQYISQHPEELQIVNYNSGINVNKQYYQPNKTLVQSTSYSFDTYENQVVVGFIKTIIKELNDIKVDLGNLKKRNTAPREKNGYIESSYYIYTRNMKMIDDYLCSINPLISKFQKLFIEYKAILPVTELIVITPPRYTNIFINLMPYKIIFKSMSDWYKCGKYDLEKSNLLLSFVSISKIYEYYCLIKINRSFEKCGFDKTDGYAYKYEETLHYTNTVYNNTFEFKKDNINVTVYFQPVIYGKFNGRERPNGIRLFRNTSISISEPNALALFDDRESQKGNCYTPDYVIKIYSDSEINYYILDAKHSNPKNIKRYQLPYLTYKYLFSLSPILQNTSILGLYILCGKIDKDINDNDSENLRDIANNINTCILPEARIINLTGLNIDQDSQIIDLINHIVDNAR